MSDEIPPDPPGSAPNGFEFSNKKYSYKGVHGVPTQNPDLRSIKFNGNLDHMKLLKRQQKAEWPEFSWCSEIHGKKTVETSRVFQQFAHDISRIGYDDFGRSYAIICPQQGAYSPQFGAFNVEVTVTGQRGWVNEGTKQLAADVSVHPKIWFSPSSKETMLPFMKDLFEKMEALEIEGWNFPFSKEHAIELNTCAKGKPHIPYVQVRDGICKAFQPPNRPDLDPKFVTTHYEDDDFFQVYNLEIQMMGVDNSKSKHPAVAIFNDLVLDLFNVAKGNMLQTNNVLTWNLWATKPTDVDIDEWEAHAEKWRKSIDTDHGSPGGKGTPPRYTDGTAFEAMEEKLKEAEEFLHDHPLEAAAGCCALSCCTCLACKWLT